MNWNFGDPSNNSEGIVEFPVSRDFVDVAYLIEVKYTKTDTYKSIDFTFEYRGTQFPTKVGARFTHKEFDPSERGPNVTDKQFQDNQQRAANRMKHILSRFVPEDVLMAMDFPDFETMGTALQNSLMKYAQNKPCKLKVTYRNNYPAFPMFPAFVSTDLKPSDFSWNPTYDKDVKTDQSQEAVGGSSAAAPPPPPPSGGFAPPSTPAQQPVAPTEGAQQPAQEQPAQQQSAPVGGNAQVSF